MYKIVFRALEPEDLELLYRWENDTSLWHYSDTLTPLSRYNLREYINTSHLDIAVSRQVRFVAELDGVAVGFADLFDYDVHNRRAAVGILVFEQENRGKGIGCAMLSELCRYAKNVLSLHQLYASVGEDNKASLRLFEKCGFERCGYKKDWRLNGDRWDSVIDVQNLFL